MMRTVTVSEVEYIAFKMAQEMLAFHEPIPNFTTRFPNILESCLATPFQSFSKKPLYSGLIPKASILFYLMIKNHPFQNGNKRIAMTTLFVFLYKNKKWIQADSQELYNMTVWVASSPPQFKNEVLKAIDKFLKTHVISLNHEAPKT